MADERPEEAFNGEGFDPVRIGTRMEAVLMQADAARVRLRNLHPTAGPDDPRRAVAAQFVSVIAPALLAMIHFFENVTEEEWWEKRGLQTSRQKIYSHDYVVFMNLWCFREPFNQFEAGLRAIVREFDPTACKAGTDDFKNIYAWLFKRLKASGWAHDRDDAVSFLDVYRTERNLMHNNYMHISPSQDDMVLTWRGRTFTFRHGQAPDWADWEFHLDFFSELVRLNEAVMSAPLLRRS